MQIKALSVSFQGEAGVFGGIKVAFEDGALFFRRAGPKWRLVLMTDTPFFLDGLDSIWVEFVVRVDPSFRFPDVHWE